MSPPGHCAVNPVKASKGTEFKVDTVMIEAPATPRGYVTEARSSQRDAGTSREHRRSLAGMGNSGEVSCLARGLFPPLLGVRLGWVSPHENGSAWNDRSTTQALQGVDSQSQACASKLVELRPNPFFLTGPPCMHGVHWSGRRSYSE